MNKVRNNSILVVDDEPIVRESLKDWLKSSGYEVTTAEDGEQALSMIQRQDFGVVVLDLRLPGKDGIKVFREAREHRPDLKAIIITAYPTVDTTTKSLRAGALDYLIKPFDPEELEKLIEKILGRDRIKEEMATETKSSTSDKASISMMEEERIFASPKEFKQKAVLRSMQEYKVIYNWSISDPEGFWGQIANQLEWYRKWDKFQEYNFTDKPEIRHFIGGKINVCYNCIDRHLETSRKNKAAIIWQGEPDGDSKVYTYQQLHLEVCKFANVLKKLGVKKGNTVAIYLPMIPELAIAMLACARIGAIHSVVFGGFSAEALRGRIVDCQAKILITADGYYSNGGITKIKDSADAAVSGAPQVKDVVVVRRLGIDINMTAGQDHWWHEEVSAKDIPSYCEPEIMDADDPLFILYTSGSIGKPKGVVHVQGGYLVYVYQSMKWIFDIKDDDTYWCTADVGGITGHSYILYGPLAVGTTSLMFEGVPTYPEPDRFWQIIEKYRVNIFYTAPIAIKSLMRHGEEWPNKHDLSSLRLLGSVGEPINPEVWMWYHRVIGKETCPIVDTWWQTETGGILMSPLPGAIPTKPGSATLPFPGVEPVILREDGTEVGINEGGYLCIKKPWPGMMRTIFNEPQWFKETYFTKFPGYYCTKDGARRDEDGYYWLMGRIDDVIKVSGHRISTAEVESALDSHPKVAEAVVVRMPHLIKGEGIYAYVTLKVGEHRSAELDKELKNHVCQQIGPIATPDKIQFADALPKTRSGKIIRRILVKIAAGNIGQLGDTTTLANPSVVDSLVKERVQ